MARYGSVHRVSDFLKRVLPRRGGGDYAELFVHHAIDLLQAMDKIQEQNPWFTLTVHAGDGIWITYRGKRLVLVLPAQSFLRLLVVENDDDESKALADLLDQLTAKGGASTANEGEDYRQWRLYNEGFPKFQAFLSKLKKPSLKGAINDPSHPRNFPGAVRELALELFERNGAMCPGVANRLPRHKVDRKKDRIEFDHVLPHARGGSSSEVNVQVLCQACNRAKRATAS